MKEIYQKNNCLYLCPKLNQTAESIIKKIFNVIKNSHAQKIQVDLIDFNMFVIFRIISLLTADSLISNINTKYEFIVKNQIIANTLKPLTLSNCTVSVEDKNFSQNLVLQSK